MTDDHPTRSEPEPPPMPGYPVPAQAPPPAPEQLPPPPAAQPAAPAAEDRVWLHFAWEGTLLVLLAGAIGLWWLFGGDTELLQDPGLLRDRLYGLAPFLLLATALAASIRVRAVNLAVGAVAGLAALLFVKWEDDGRLIAAALVVAAALATTLALVALVAVLRVPGWAASLGAAVAVLASAAVIAEDEGIEIAPSATGLLGAVRQIPTVTTGEELVWVVVSTVLAVSVLGGTIGILPPVRRRLEACRAEAGASDRRTLAPAVSTGTGLLVSNLLAAGAGVLLVIPAETATAGLTVPAEALEPAGVTLALAIVLLGGTSLWGKRGGVFGTLLAALAVFAVFVAFEEVGWSDQSYWIVVGALALGFGVSWLVERFGTRSPRPAELPPLDSVAALAEPEPPAATDSEEPAPPPAPEPDPVPTAR